MPDDSTKSFKDAFNSFLKNEHLDEKYHEKKLISSWNELMGGPIANRTTDLFIKEKIMYVKLSSAPLRQELTMSKPKILEILERSMGRKVIEDIRFI